MSYQTTKQKGSTDSLLDGFSQLFARPPSDQEMQLIQASIALSRARLKGIKDAGKVLDKEEQLAFNAIELMANSPDFDGSTDPARRALATQQLKQALKGGQAVDELTRYEIASIMGGGEATDKQRALIGKSLQGAWEMGTSNIDEAHRDSMEILSSETAPMLGMRRSDGPITQRGEQVTEAAFREKAQLGRQLSSQGAQMELEYPLKQGQLQAARVGDVSNRILGTTEFQQNFERTQMANRMGMTNQVVAGRLGQATSGIDPTGALDILQRGRLAQGQTTFSQAGSTDFVTRTQGGGFAINICWVAEELWGADHPATHYARSWASTHDNWFTRLYRKHGVEWAEWLHEHEWAKPLVAPIWRWMARRGMEGT